MTPVTRTAPLEHSVTWSFTAGPEGAMSYNSAVGLTVVIPAGALATTQTISVTALAGSHVAYQFEPHLVFASTVRLAQDLSSVSAVSLLGLVGSHFADDLVVLNGLAVVTEIVPASVSILTGTISLDVEHFSGWIVASGNEGTPPDNSSGSSQ